jgi:hypothetical protein
MKQTPAGRMVMTQAEYARHRGVNPSHISRLKERGILVMRGKLVDVAASDAVLDDKPVDVEPQQAAPPPQFRPAPDSLGGQTGASFGQARTVEMVFRAKLRKLEYEARQGEMIKAEVVRKSMADAGRTIRDGILGLPDRLATVLAAEGDAKKIHVTLKTELSRELEALANAIDAI